MFSFRQHLQFDLPGVIFGGFILVMCLTGRWWIQSSRSAMYFQFTHFFQPSKLTKRMVRAKRFLYLFVISCALVLLSGPHYLQTRHTTKNNTLVIAFDVSPSMNAIDVVPTRLAAAKNILQELIAQRPDDTIGLVFFAGSALVALPPSNDHQLITDMIQKVTPQDNTTNDSAGTALGEALLASVDLLDPAAPNRSQQIIVLTDGGVNRGIDVTTVAKLAASKHIQIHAIAVGTQSGGVLPTSSAFGNRQIPVPGVDLTQLKTITQLTAGTLTNSENLQVILQHLQTTAERAGMSPSVTTFSVDLNRYILIWVCMGIVLLALFERKSPIL